MVDDKLEENLFDALVNLRGLIDKLRSVSEENGCQIDLQKDFYEGVGLDWGERKLERSANSIGSLESLSSRDFLPVSFLSELNAKSADIKDVVVETGNIVDGILARAPKWTTFYSGTQVVSQQRRQFDISVNIRKIIEKIDSFLKAYFIVFLYFDNKNSSYLNEIIESSKDGLRSINENRDSSNIYLSEILDKRKNINENFNEISEIKKLSLEGGEEIEGFVGDFLKKKEEEIDSALRNISEALDQAGEMAGSVKAYGNKFEEFDESLDERNRLYEDLYKKSKETEQNLDSSAGYIVALIEQAEGMLSSATAAGLAHHFEETKKNLDTELEGAKKGVWLSIGVLGVLSIPLFILILSPLFPLLGFFFPNSGFDWKFLTISNATNSWSYLGQAFSRAVVILPGVWLVIFSSSRYKDIFKLREHYSYKYTMAVSVEGFKKQAAGYESEIAAMVFERIGFNPADKMEKSMKGAADELIDKTSYGALIVGLRDKVFGRREDKE
ncbi:hypothetical protein [Alcaligenes phenolicus]|uniref:hypothetical protein n=1 Tax=Alcaligenes phenolicus TaxID=232846 RepID=UPI000B1A75AF|nr:hypothetical protein [Alcaligenes phenolicus]